MKWLKREDVVDFVNKHDYDIRKTGRARWIDQKCTPDVLTIVSDCIIQYVESIETDKDFNSNDVWHYEYAVENVEQIFKKPNPNEKKAENEYDKFFAQPMELLSYAGVLTDERISKHGRHKYKILNKDLLEFIALSDKNALLFLQCYIEKVISDSGLNNIFNDYFSKQTKDSLDCLRKQFIEFIHTYTDVKKVLEPKRMFPKILNPLAFLKNKKGIILGKPSKDTMKYDILMYNRDNFRDIYSEKPKGMTRKEYIDRQDIRVSFGHVAYFTQKAKRIVREFNYAFREGKSEYNWENDTEQATQIHHIFPASEYPKISSYCENLIALTPNQHYLYAHPDNNTAIVSKDFQHLLLIAKADRIEENLTNEEQSSIYEFYKFMFVLDMGLQCERFCEIADGDYKTAINEINLAYMIEVL